MLGYCQECGKVIKRLFKDDPLSKNPDGALYITKISNCGPKIPYIVGTYGSSHDGDGAFIIDKDLLNKIKTNLETENTELFICDECFDKNVDKFVMFEGMSFPWNYGYGNSKKFNYLSIPRKIVALNFQELMNISDKDQRTFRIRVNKNTCPVKVVTDYDESIKIQINYDETLIINENLTFDKINSRNFNKYFVPQGE